MLISWGTNMSIYDNGYDQWIRKGDNLTSPVALSSDSSVPSLSSSSSGSSSSVSGSSTTNNPINNSVSPNSIDSGTLGSLLGYGKKEFTDTIAGFLMGKDSDNIYKFIIGSATSSMDWAVTTPNTLTIVGSITATTGSIGGFSIGATTITATNLILDSANQRISLGTGNEIIILDADDATYRIWVGHATAASAPFSVSKTGSIIATAGTIGGWILGSTYLTTDATTANANILIDKNNSLIRLGATTGNYITIDGANQRIRSSNYVSGVFGSGFTLESNLLEVGNIAARGMIRTAVFQKDVVSAVGGNLAVLDSDVLDTDMTALDSMTLTIKGTTSFSVGDLLRIKDGVDDEWMEVTNIASAPTYVVTRDKAGDYTADTNPTWRKGASVVNYGQSGDGGVYMTASETNAPYLSIFTQAGSPWTSITTKVRLGNLTGLTNPMTGGALSGYGLWTDNVYLTGVIVASSGKIGSADNYWSIGATGLTAVSTNSDVILNYGKTDFGEDATSGFILGYDYSATKLKFEIGSSATKILTYDGTDFTLKGGTIIGGTIKTQDTSAPDVQIDTTDGITVTGESIWFALSSAASAKTFASYSETNYTSPSSVYAGSIISRGQTFVPAYSGQLGTCELYLKKVGSPTGTFTAKIFAMSGTYGTDGIPTGSALATSDAYDISTLTTSIALITLTFSGANQIDLFTAENYVLVVSYNAGDASNYLDVGKDNTAPSYGGTSVYTSDDAAWSYTTGVNLIFYIYTLDFGTDVGRISANSISGVRLSNLTKTGVTSNYAISLDANNSDINIVGGNVYMESYWSYLDIEKQIELGPEDYVYINGTLKLRPLLSTTPLDEEGNIYFDTTDKHFYGYDGTTWLQLDN